MFGPLKKSMTRLGQWRGRRRSTRDEPALPRFLHRRMLTRAGAVLATTLAVTLLASWGTPPLPYRLGEIYPYDLRVRVDFEVVNRVGLANLENNVATPRPAEPRPIIESYQRGMI